MKNVKLILATFALIAFAACNSDEDAIVIPVSEGAVLDIGVGGPTQPNMVYVDLSTDDQSSVNRSGWDLGFYAGDKFSVILNGAAEVMARNLEKNNFEEITRSDYEGLAEQMTVDAIFSNLFAPPPYPEWMSESSDWIDDPEGNLSNTAIAEVNSNPDLNEIYLINRGFTPEESSRGAAVMVKVIQNGSGYTLQFQGLDSENVQSINIEKNDSHNFVYINFDDGIVDAEPEKDSWDLVFTPHMEKLDAGGGTFIPYTFQDYVLQNRNSVTVAEIQLEEEVDLLAAYDVFTLGDVAGNEFDDKINAIGSSWRTVANPTPGSVTGVRTDGFYLVEDAAGNQYKLLFTGMVNETGERGFPQITYELLK